MPNAVSVAIQVTVNGSPLELPAGTTVRGLLLQMGIETGRVAVERNREVVPRARHHDAVLVEGDHVEVVTFVGGG